MSTPDAILPRHQHSLQQPRSECGRHSAPPAPSGVPRNLAGDVTLLACGEEAGELYRLVDGWILGSIATADRSVVSAIHLPGDLVDPHWLHAPATLTYRTQGEVTVECIPRSAILASMGNAGVAATLWKGAAACASRAVQWAVNLSRGSAVERVGRLFCEVHLRLAKAGRASGPACEFPLDGMTIADCVGLTKAHTLRVIEQLRMLNLATLRKSRLVINDFARLSAFAGFDPAYLQPF